MNNNLEKYKEKRDFAKTNEPKSNKVSPYSNNLIFVVQEHHSKRLHYDFRLEKDGVLLSWAVPKVLPVEPNIKRLAIRTEAHPMGYATFEGTIPEGNYGAGKVIIWDTGTYESIENSNSKIKIRLAGAKLKGTYVLTKLSSEKEQWLLFKVKE